MLSDGLQPGCVAGCEVWVVRVTLTRLLYLQRLARRLSSSG